MWKLWKAVLEFFLSRWLQSKASKIVNSRQLMNGLVLIFFHLFISLYIILSWERELSSGKKWVNSWSLWDLHFFAKWLSIGKAYKERRQMCGCYCFLQGDQLSFGHLLWHTEFQRLCGKLKIRKNGKLICIEFLEN